MIVRETNLRENEPDDELLDEALERLEELGEGSPDADFEELVAGDNALAQSLASNPALRNRVAERFAALRHMAGLIDLARGHEQSLPRIPGFEIVGLLGHGGAGVVYRARQLSLDRDIALKLMLGGRFVSQRARDRFRREAETTARLQHPNIAQIYDNGEVDGLPYLTQEFVRGGTLAQRIAGQPRSPRESAVLLETIAEAVYYAHQNGVIHRDLKPSNVLLTAAGEPKITDFGLAKATEFENGLTYTGEVPGTPSYMAPEQVSRGAVGPASDVYALGAMLLELLTGRPPFAGASATEVFARVLHEPHHVPKEVRQSVPADLLAIVQKCLEKNPQQRYPSAAELAHDLRRWRDGEPTKARPLGRVATLGRWARRRPTAAALVAVSCLATLTIVGGSAAFTWRLAASLHDSEERRAEAVVARAEAEKHRADAIRERDGNAEFLYAARMRQGFELLGEGSVKRVAGLLENYEEGTSYAGLRNFEWHYLKRSLHDERLSLTGHKGEVYGVAFSPDGRLLASAAEDGLIKLWEPTSGQELRTIAAHNSCANELSFSPDGRLLASAGCDHMVKIWDTSTWRELSSFTAGPNSIMTAVAFSPDGRLLAAGDNYGGTVSIWDAVTDMLLTRIEATPFDGAASKGVQAVAWSPNGKWLATASFYATTRLWSTDDWAMVRELPPSSVVAFSPDTKLLATQDKSELRLCDAESGEVYSALEVRSERAQVIAFAADGRQLYSCGSGGGIRIWTLSDDGRVAIENRGQGVTAPVERMLLGHTSRVQGFAVAPDSRTLASASFDGTIRLWDLAHTGGALPVLHCPAVAAAMSADLGRLTTVTGDGQIVTRDAFSGRIVEEYPFPKKDVFRDFGLSPDAKWPFAIHSTENLWMICNDASPCAPRFLTKFVGRLKFSGDGRFVAAAGDDGFVRVWDTETASEQFAVEFPFSPGDNTYIWAQEVPLVLSADGRLLAIMSAAPQILDTVTGKRVEIAQAAADVPEVSGMAFSDDARLLVVARSDGSVTLIESASGSRLRTMRIPGAAESLAFSPDNRTLAAASVTGVVMLGHVGTGQELTHFSSKPGEVAALRFSDDGGALAEVVIKDQQASLYVWSSR